VEKRRMKGIILAGGTGSRLLPITSVISKQLLPVYDKPMIFYPLSTLMLAGIKEILIISTPQDAPRFKQLLGDGLGLGLSIEYAIQERPGGIAQAFIIGENFIDNDNCMLILGDNLFFGNDLQKIMQDAILNRKGSTIFAYPVSDPKRYGVVEFDENYRILSIEEKPENPKSEYAVTGLYLYDNKVVDIAKQISPSSRGELEITAINKKYLKNQELNIEVFGRGMAWLDTGTPASLMEAGELVKVIQNRQGYVISCPEEISWRNGWINKEQLEKLASQYGNSAYKEYLLNL
jgi:glucose-1-phosphate thymidylyltransferase